MDRFEEKALSKSAKYLARGKVDSAVEVVQAALGEKPESALLLLEMSRLRLKLGQRDDSASSVRRVLKTGPAGLEQVENYVADLRMAGDDVTPYYETIVDHHLRGRDLLRAVEILERMRTEIPACRDRNLARTQKLLSENPGRPINPQLLHSVYLVSLCHELTGQNAAATQIYFTVLERNPQEAEAVLGRMAALLLRDHKNSQLRLKLIEGWLRSGKVKEAVEQCSLALDIDARAAAQVAGLLDAAAGKAADPAPLQLPLARARAAEGKVDECLAALRPLVEKGRELEPALMMLEDLARRNTDSPGILALLSEIYLQRGKSREALATFMRLPNPPAEEAERVYRRILARDPSCFPATQKLVQLLAESGRAEEAGTLSAAAIETDTARAGELAPQLHQVLSSSPGDRRAHLLLARGQAQQGEREQAGLLMRRLLAADPESTPEVGAALAALPPPPDGTPEARHLRLARLEESLARGDFAAAAAAAEAAIGIEPPALPDALAPAAHLIVADPACAPRLRAVLEPRSGFPGCEAALEYLAGECAAAEGRIHEALQRWRVCVGARPEAIPVVRLALTREHQRPGAPVDVDVALIDLALDERNFAEAARALTDIMARRPEASAACLDRFARLVREQPDNIELRVGLCAAYAACRQFDQALALGEETTRMEDSERTASIHLTLADLLIERDDARRAIKRLLHAHSRNAGLATEVVRRLEGMRQRNPSQPLVPLALGRLLGMIERPDEAVDALAEAWRLDPAQSEAVLEELEKLRSHHTPGPVMRMLLARIWTTRREHDKAVEILGQMLDVDSAQARSVLLVSDKILVDAPDLAAAHLVRGRALLAQGHAAAATEEFEKTHKLDPQSTGLLLTWCRKAIETDPSAPEPYLFASELYRLEKQPAAAAGVLSAGLARALPGRERFMERLTAVSHEVREDSSILLTLAQEHLASGNPEAAVRTLVEALNHDVSLSDAATEAVERTLAAHPDLPDAYLVRARLKSRRGKLDPALADVNEFLRRCPSRRTEAVPALAALRKRDPRHFGVLTALCDILTEERRFDEAGALFKEGLASAAEPARKLNLYMRQWRMYLVQGKEALARQVLDNAQALAPDRNQFLDAVHRLLVERARQGVDQLRERTRSGEAGAADIEALISALILLGEHEEARRELAQYGARFERPRFARLHAAIAERRGDFRRALEMGRAAGTDRRLVYCAERAGEFEEAHRLLGKLVEEGRDVILEPRLARYELEILRRDLDKDRNVLQAETVVAFGR